MLPSQALLAGIRMIPRQAWNEFLQWQGGRLVAACAIGTACVGAGVPALEGCYLPDFARLEATATGRELNNTVCNPVTGRYNSALLVVQDLNDKCKWSRERIVEWLQSVGL